MARSAEWSTSARRPKASESNSKSISSLAPIRSVTARKKKSWRSRKTARSAHLSKSLVSADGCRPTALRIAREAEGGPESRIRKPLAAQHLDLCTTQRLRGGNAAEVAAVELIHQHLGGVVADVPKSRDHRRRPGVKNRAGQSHDLVAAAATANARAARG